MKLGVISDTHLASPDATLERIVRDDFQGVDLLVHLGDYVNYSVADFLMKHHDFVGVSGNMDPPEIRDAFPRKQVLELEGFRIGMIHGWGPPFGLEEKIIKEFSDVDAILYGHTHKAVSHEKKGIFLFNPGSPTRSFLAQPTVGLVSIENTIGGEILRVNHERIKGPFL